METWWYTYWHTVYRWGPGRYKYWHIVHHCWRVRWKLGGIRTGTLYMVAGEVGGGPADISIGTLCTTAGELDGNLVVYVLAHCRWDTWQVVHWTWRVPRNEFLWSGKFGDGMFMVINLPYNLLKKLDDVEPSSFFFIQLYNTGCRTLFRPLNELDRSDDAIV